jgi:predicted amidohydrolase
MHTIRTALVQFDAEPERTADNLAKMKTRVEQARKAGARWVIFHEATVCDYTPRVSECAERVPAGASTRFMMELAKRQDCYISFGLTETEDDRYYIAQVFVGPTGFVYRYRKTWLWREPDDEGFRNEWERYDPGSGPELFEFDGIEATCFICADGEAPRCIERAGALRPQVAFYPNNRASLPDFDVFGRLAEQIGAPMLVTNRTGKSWIHDCQGGCAAYSADGRVLAKANRNGNEEILLFELEL